MPTVRSSYSNLNPCHSRIVHFDIPDEFDIRMRCDAADPDVARPPSPVMMPLSMTVHSRKDCLSVLCQSPLDFARDVVIGRGWQLSDRPHVATCG